MKTVSPIRTEVAYELPPALREMRTCACGRETLVEKTATEVECFRCYRAREPVVNVPGLRIDAAGDDSSDQRRVREGSHIFNAGLPGVETVIGTRSDGMPKLAYRPVTNREVSSNRKRRELAKRGGLGVEDSGIYRSPKS